MTSILSSVRRGVEENGRIYPAYGKHEYGMPVDEKELDRMDLQHHKFTLMLDDKLFIAPISDQVLDRPDSRVLDIGTGSGIWAIVIHLSQVPIILLTIFLPGHGRQIRC